MLINTSRGRMDVPKLEAASGNAQCRFCPNDTKIPKGDKCVFMAINSGPTGKFYLCMTHAKQLGEELVKISE